MSKAAGNAAGVRAMTRMHPDAIREMVYKFYAHRSSTRIFK
jgi:hypothetical protein